MSKIFQKIFSIGIFLILIMFNPFIFPGLYFDSTSSYGFIASSKIWLLGILNIVLVIFWIVRIKKEDGINLTTTQLYAPILGYFLLSLISYLTSINQTISLWGYNYTLENSFAEIFLIVTFFIIFINNIRDTIHLEEIIRWLCVSISIIILCSIVRFSGLWEITASPFNYFLNSLTFTPLGHYGSVLILLIIAIIFGITLIISDYLYPQNKNNIYIDFTSLIINIFAFGVLINLRSNGPEYFYLIIFLIISVVFGWFINTNNRLKKYFWKIVPTIGISLSVGILVQFFWTSQTAQPSSYPNIDISQTWAITLDSINNSSRALFGNGQSTFANYFDLYKDNSFAAAYDVNGEIISNFSTNSQSPNTEEIRIFQSPSYLLNIISTNGIIGLFGFLAIIGTAIYTAITQKKIKENLWALSSFFALLILSIFLIVLRTDFIITFIFWFILGAYIISSKEDEPQGKLIVALTSKALNTNHIWSYVIPSIIGIFSLLIVFVYSTIILSNYHLFNAKLSQVNNDKDKYNENISKVYLNTDLSIREVVNANVIILFEKLNTLKEKSAEYDENDSSKKTELETLANEINSLQSGIINQLNIAISINPNEYKNYFYAGYILSYASEFTEKFALDSTALEYLNAAIQRNPHHPDSYYELAKIYYRNNQANAALNQIQPAVQMLSQELVYAELLADINVAVEDYSSAIKIYESLKQIKEANPENQSLKDFYESKDIEKDLENAKIKLEEQNSKNNTESQNPSTPVTPSITATPTPSTKLTPTKSN